MTAAPPGSWDGAGVRSLEMRWIFPDRLAAAMAGWFGRFPAQTTVTSAPALSPMIRMAISCPVWWPVASRPTP